MIHSSVDPRQSIPLSFLPNSLHAAASASGVSHSSASRAGLGAAPLFLDDHLSVSSRLRSLKRAASRLLHPPSATLPKTSQAVVSAPVAATKASSPSVVSDTSNSSLVLTPPASPPQSFVPIPAASGCRPGPSQRACIDSCVNKLAETQEPVHLEPPTTADDSAYLLTPVTSPKPPPISSSTRPSVTFAADLVTQTIPTYSHDEYPDRSDAMPPRRLKFAEAAQIMAFQSLMRRQHVMIAVDDEAPGFVHEKCPACKGYHAPLSAKMDGWTVPTLEEMEERGL